MFDAPVLEATKANGSNSVQGRYSGQPGYDMPGVPINPFTYLTINLSGLQSDGIPNWSYFPQIRDFYLRLLSRKEPIMAGALYSGTSRIKALPWKVKGGRNMKIWAQSLLGEADDGAGFEQFIGKVVTDLHTQDNGAFIELAGAGRPDKPLKGRVQALYHLDSAQCWRTFDPEFPVIYTNPLDNSYHRMHRSRVIMLSNNPQSDERARNVGFCTVSRALKMLQIVRHLQSYKDEKISGNFKRGIIYGGPATPKQFNNAVDKADLDSENALLTVLNNLPVILTPNGELKLNMLNLASLPDGFDYEKEINIYVYILALCFGVDAREFWPATASGATKADASVQHLKAQGKGQADIIKSLETAFNWQVFPEGVELEFDAHDDEQDKNKADIDTVRITNVGLMQTQGNITAQEGRALLINQGVIDPKQLVSSEDAELADDSAPLDTSGDQIPQPQPGQVDEFDMTQQAQQGLKYDPEAPRGAGRFAESKHPRASNGKFGSGGSTPTSSPKPAAAPATPAPAATNNSPIVNALISYLKSVKMLGKYKNGRLSVPGETKDRSGDLQSYLRSNGFPNDKVTAKQTKKGFTYSISGVEPKKPRKKAAQKANPEIHVNAYQKKLEGMVTTLIDKVAANPSSFKSAVNTLQADFLADLPQDLTDAYGVGLAGEDATDDGIDQLKDVAAKSADYFKTSFIADLAAVAIAGLTADEIKTKLNPFVSRLGMYAGSYWQSVWEGVRDATPVSRRVKWVLEPGAEHCGDCEANAGEYDSIDEMERSVGLPGSGQTQCLGNCRCRLEVENEDGDFASLVSSPTVFTKPLFEVEE